MSWDSRCCVFCFTCVSWPDWRQVRVSLRCLFHAPKQACGVSKHTIGGGLPSPAAPPPFLSSAFFGSVPARAHQLPPPPLPSCVGGVGVDVLVRMPHQPSQPSALCCGVQLALCTGGPPFCRLTLTCNNVTPFARHIGPHVAGQSQGQLQWTRQNRTGTPQAEHKRRTFAAQAPHTLSDQS